MRKKARRRCGYRKRISALSRGVKKTRIGKRSPRRRARRRHRANKSVAIVILLFVTLQIPASTVAGEEIQKRWVSLPNPPWIRVVTWARNLDAISMKGNGSFYFAPARFQTQTQTLTAPPVKNNSTGLASGDPTCFMKDITCPCVVLETVTQAVYFPPSYNCAETWDVTFTGIKGQPDHGQEPLRKITGTMCHNGTHWEGYPTSQPPWVICYTTQRSVYSTAGLSLQSWSYAGGQASYGGWVIPEWISLEDETPDNAENSTVGKFQDLDNEITLGTSVGAT